eukprot:352101-Chlamydomonas_euryale.AAC.3
MRAAVVGGGGEGKQRMSAAVVVGRGDVKQRMRAAVVGGGERARSGRAPSCSAACSGAATCVSAAAHARVCCAQSDAVVLLRKMGHLTEIMVVGQPMTLPKSKLSGKGLLVTDIFKYLRSFFADGGSMSRDMDV